MFLDPQHNVEIAGRATPGSRLAVAGEPHSHPCLDTRRDPQLELCLAVHTAGAGARVAGAGNLSAATPASVAGLRHREEAALKRQLPSPGAGRAGFDVLGSGSASLALRATLHPRNPDRGLEAADRFLEFDLQIEAQIPADRRPPSATRSTEDAAQTEQVAQNVAEVGKDLLVESR